MHSCPIALGVQLHLLFTTLKLGMRGATRSLWLNRTASASICMGPARVVGFDSSTIFVLVLLGQDVVTLGRMVRVHLRSPWYVRCSSLHVYRAALHHRRPTAPRCDL